MQEREKLQEIESMGSEEPEWEEPEKSVGGKGIVSIIQVAVCALAMVALVYFKLADTEKFDAVIRWYRGEITKEIDLPRWEGGAAAPPLSDNTQSDGNSTQHTGLDSLGLELV